MLRYLAYGQKDLSVMPVQPMTRFNWEFYAVLSGALRPTSEHGGQVPYITTPTLWVFPPDRAHGWQSRRRVDRIVMHFSSVPDVIREACASAGSLSTPLTADDVAMLRRMGNELKQHYRSPTPESLLRFDRALIDLSLLFLRGRDFGSALPLETVAVERVQRAIEWYLSHLHQRPTLFSLADAVHISTAHLRRQFRLVYRKSPHLVLTSLRLERAAQLLATTDNTLDVVARGSGFNSASDFCRVFKHHFDVYPNEWRTQVGGEENPGQQLQRLVARVEIKPAVTIANEPVVIPKDTPPLQSKAPGKPSRKNKARPASR
jgi:AraC family transcriptional regulator